MCEAHSSALPKLKHVDPSRPMAVATGCDGFVATSAGSHHSAGVPSPGTPDLDATTRRTQSNLIYLKFSPSLLWGEETVASVHMEIHGQVYLLGSLDPVGTRLPGGSGKGLLHGD